MIVKYMISLCENQFSLLNWFPWFWKSNSVYWIGFKDFENPIQSTELVSKNLEIQFSLLNWFQNGLTPNFVYFVYVQPRFFSIGGPNKQSNFSKGSLIGKIFLKHIHFAKWNGVSNSILVCSVSFWVAASMALSIAGCLATVAYFVPKLVYLISFSIIAATYIYVCLYIGNNQPCWLQSFMPISPVSSNHTQTS